MARATLAVIDERRLVMQMTERGMSDEDIARTVGKTLHGVMHIRGTDHASQDVDFVSPEELVYRCFVDDGDRLMLVDELCRRLNDPRSKAYDGIGGEAIDPRQQVAKARRVGFLSANEFQTLQSCLGGL